MKTICILNPTAGRGKAIKKWKTCNERLIASGCEVITKLTTSSGDAAAIAKQALSEGFETIIVAGGDGTLNEVVGVAAGTDVKLALAPFGTGNDLARGLGITRDPVRWAERFPTLKVIKLDLGTVNGRYFVNQAGFGFDARVAHKINSGIGFLRGKVAYLAAIALCLRNFETVEVEIEVEDQVISKRILMASFANSPFVGGGLMTVPGANPSDNQLDLFILEELSRFEFLKSFPLILKGNHINHPAVSFYRGKQFLVRASTKQFIHVDGEIYEADNLEVLVKPKTLNFLI